MGTSVALYGQGWSGLSSKVSLGSKGKILARASGMAVAEEWR